MGTTYAPKPRYEMVIDHEEHQLYDFSAQPVRNCYTVSGRSVCLSLLLVLLLNVLFIATLVFRQPFQSCHPRPLVRAQEMFPNFPLRLVTFERDDSFGKSSPEDPNSAWETILPEGKGAIEVPDPKQWHLEGGYPVSNGTSSTSELYGLSMFHQLHCLATLKSEFAKFVKNSPGETHIAGRDEDGRDEGIIGPEHLEHCFDYLRQAIMCAGDLTLEKAIVKDGVPIASVDGWGVVHQCQDWKAMFDFAESHRGYNSRGILNSDEIHHDRP